MAITSNTYTGNGSNKLFSITFPYLETSDIDVYLNGTLQTITTQYFFANATTVEFVAAPANGAIVKIDRSTDDSDNPATFFPGSSIKAADLNENFDQTLYVVQEINNNAVKLADPLYANKTYIDAQDATKVNKSGDTMSGNLVMGGNRVTGLGTPSVDADSATKLYVDQRYGELGVPGLTRWRKTATAGQTVFSGVGEDSNTLAYSASRESVFINGAYQQRGVDYTANNGTSITFTPALILGDVVDVHCVNNAAGVATDQASGVYFTQSGTGALTRTVDSKLKDMVSVKDFGAKGDGVTNDTAAIQAALDSVPNGASSYAPSKVSGGAGRVSLFFPPGDYIVTAPLDMSQRDYVRLVADGRATIYSSSTSYIIDMASADHCVIDGLSLYSTTARVGIYINRCTSNPYAMFNTIRNVTITLTPNVTANSGNGRIGIYNNRGEQNVFENLVLRCDVPYWAQATADSTFPPTSGTQDLVIVSATVNIHIQCNFIANGTHNVGVVLKDVLSFEFLNCYWARAALTSGSLNYAVYAENINRCTFTGSNEVFARFMLVVGSLYSICTNIIMDVPYLDAGGVFNLDTAGNNGVLDSHIRVLVAGGTPAVGACIFKDSGAATNIQIIGNLIETTGLMIPITTVGGGTRAINKNIIKTDSELSLSNAVLTSASSASLTVTGGSINSTPVGATTRSTGAFTTVEANTSATVGSNLFAKVSITLSDPENAMTTYRGTPDGTGWEHAKTFGGRDTEDGFTYGSYLGLYTEGKASGTTDTSTEKVRCTANGHLRPIGDNTQSLGKSGSRWSVVYAGTGTINTSDANEKQQIAELSEAEQAAATAIKGLIRKFKFNDAVAVKGDNARIHVGVIAQDVEQAFIDEGLDPVNYGLFCRDEWWEIDGQPVAATDDGSVISTWYELDGEVVYPGENEEFPDGAKQISKTTQAIKRIRLGIRYEELLAFIISAL